MQKVLFVCLVLFLSSVFSRSDYRKEFLEAVRLFSGEFYYTIAEEYTPNEVNNLVFSPLSIYLTLGMVLAGSNGNTSTELMRTMKLLDYTKRGGRYALKDWQIHGYMAALYNLVAGQSIDNTLTVANAMFVANDFPVEATFLKSLDVKYDAYFRNLSFSENEESKRIINGWVSNQTNDKISELVDEINADTKLILVNAVYFNALWKEPFKEADTPIQFNLPNGQQAERPAMQAVLSIRYYFHFTTPASIYHYIAIPYSSSTDETHTYFIIIKPELPSSMQNFIANAKETLKKLNPEDWPIVQRRLKIPKFEISTKVDVQDVLEEMGLQILFNQECDLRGISAVKPLFVSKFDHKAYINVNEKGTEAAAATSVKVGPKSLTIYQNITVDRSFFFAIYNARAKIYTFLGQIDDPKPE